MLINRKTFIKGFLLEGNKFDRVIRANTRANRKIKIVIFMASKHKVCLVSITPRVLTEVYPL